MLYKLSTSIKTYEKFSLFFLSFFLLFLETPCLRLKNSFKKYKCWIYKPWRNTLRFLFPTLF